MSKSQKGYNAEDFAHVTPDLLAQIDRVLVDKQQRRYSTSAIYTAHNKLFKLSEPLQSCESCLQTRAEALAKWKAWYDKQSGAPLSAFQQAVQDGTQFTLEQLDDFLLSQDMSDEERAFMVGKREELAALEQGAADVITQGLQDAAAAQHSAMVDDIAGPQTEEPGEALQLEGQQVTGGVPASMPAAPVPPASAAKQIVLQKANKETHAGEGDSFYAMFTQGDTADKGIVADEAGKAIAAGTYLTAGADGNAALLSVQPGGKATYKAI